MSNYSTPGVPDPEVSATAMRNATRAFPDDNNISGPRCYGQAVESPNTKTDGYSNEVAQGYQAQYTD